MDQDRVIVLLFSILLLLGGILYWFFFGNKSTLIVHDAAPYVITAENYRFFECVTESCEMQIPFGKRQICIKKDGYLPKCEQLDLPWRKKVSWRPEPVKSPALVPADSGVGAERKKPPKYEASSSTTTDGSKYRFYAASEQIFRVMEDGKQELVVSFYGIGPSQLVSAGKNLLLYNGNELYFIDTGTKNKHLLMTHDGLVIRPLQNGDVAASNGKELQLFRSADRRFIDLPFTTPPRHLAACEEDRFYYAEPKQGVVWYFFQYSPETGKTKSIVSARIDSDSEFSLYCTGVPREIGINVAGGSDRVLQY